MMMMMMMILTNELSTFNVRKIKNVEKPVTLSQITNEEEKNNLLNK